MQELELLELSRYRVSARRSRRRFLSGVLALAVGHAPLAWGANCSVPSPEHPTLGAAVRDGTCTTVQLAAGTFPENVRITRDLAVEGAGSASTSIQGFLAATGSGTEVTLATLRIDGTAEGVAGCWSEVLAALAGATVTSGADVQVLNTGIGGSVCRLFSDGFESGGTLAWSSVTP